MAVSHILTKITQYTSKSNKSPFRAVIQNSTFLWRGQGQKYSLEYTKIRHIM